MYIAHITPVFPPYKAGMGMVAKEMANGLAKRGHKIDIITPEYMRGLPEEDREEGIHIQRVRPLWKRGNAAFIPQIFSTLGKYDLLHLHYPFFGGAEVPWLFKVLYPKKPFVLTYHMDTTGIGMRQKLFHAYRKILLPQYLWSADAVTASSYDYAENSFVSEMLKKKPEKFHEIPFGVNKIFFGERDAQKEEKPTILFVGGLDTAHYFKGIEKLFEAVSKLSLAQWQVWVVGDGNLREQYEKKAKDLGMKDRVEFLGSLSDDELCIRYQKAWVTALPSLDMSEAFGLVLAESQACGTPVIASDLPGVRTAFIPQKTGLAVEPGNAADLAHKLEHILTHNEERVRMSKHAREHAEKNFRWERIVQKLENLYQQLKKT